MTWKHQSEKVFALTGVVAISILTGHAAFAAGAKPRPNLSLRAVELTTQHNATYLSDVRPNVAQNNNFFGSLFDLQGMNGDAKASATLRQSYEDHIRSYELRRAYRLVQPWEEEQHRNSMQEFARAVRMKVQQLHIRKARENVLQAAEGDKDLKALGIAAGVAAVATGQPVEIKMGEKTRLVARTDIPSERGELQFFSPTVNASFDVVAKAPASRDASTYASNDPVYKEERYRLRLSRKLPIWGLGAGLQYRGTSSDLTASVSKPLSSQLTAVFDSVHAVDAKAPTFRSSEEVVRVLYGINF